MNTKKTFRSDKIVREHDAFYLDENRKKKVKESFKFTKEILDPFLKKIKNPSIVDIGCATGDLLYYLNTQYPAAQLTGIDVMKSLLTRAKREVPQAEYILGDIYTGKGLPSKKFDATILFGTHSIFDTVEPWIDNLSNLMAKGGRAYVFGIFNPEPVDVLVRVRYADGKSHFQSGWNMISQKTILEYLHKKGMQGIFHPFTIKIDLPRHNDPLRAWTFRLAGGERAIKNGTQILHTFSLLEIRRKKR